MMIPGMVIVTQSASEAAQTPSTFSVLYTPEGSMTTAAALLYAALNAMASNNTAPTPGYTPAVPGPGFDPTDVSTFVVPKTTSLVSPVSSQATSLVVSSEDGLAKNDTLVFQDETSEVCTIAQNYVSGTTIPLTRGLSYNHAAGAQIQFYISNITPPAMAMTTDASGNPKYALVNTPIPVGFNQAKQNAAMANVMANWIVPYIQTNAVVNSSAGAVTGTTDVTTGSTSQALAGGQLRGGLIS